MLAMDKELAYTTATMIITSIPGIFGFFAWELRENWRLYAANRPTSLHPVVIGKHGESMRGLLLPGLHSGTIPKRYAKLRSAEQEANAWGRWTLVRKHLGALEDLQIYVRRFIERDLLWLLNEAGCWNGSRLYLARIDLATNRVRAELRVDDIAGTTVLEFEARSGWLLGSFSGPEVLAQLSPSQQDALATAMKGLYKSAGIDLVRQEIERQLPSPTPLYDLGEEEFLLWPEGFPATTIRYGLDIQQPTTMHTIDGPVPPNVPVVDVARLLFQQSPLPWSDWVDVWEHLATKGRSSQSPPMPDGHPQSETTSLSRDYL